ncbi:50S ribosomal protein L24 [Cryomorpha ignava]|uniref:Large ribosomal subunit protein uL24 n=1 Tax=Cryomorpha ignava TaxID=101383 RepID=A0A7K3WP82_9FLAO|nr:50S ribosomal protein L24 [Cryomorpha ignava]NEN23459.1 50S ribosomal protein L24 [Cryomorpha ignava]
MKIHIKKDDNVVVTAGVAKGQQGRVISVNRDKYRAIVEGLNIVTKHTKPSAANPQGGISKQEAGIHISNLLVVDPKSGKGSRIGYKESDGKSVRYLKKSGEQV